MLNIRRANILRGTLFGALLIDHEIIKRKNVVLVTDGASIIGVNKYEHGLLLSVVR
jgi:hypothetical protein